MARVREHQRDKRSWLQRIFFPLHLKLPLEAMALLLVCVSGYYMARTVETELKQPAVREETPVVPPETGTPVATPVQKAPVLQPPASSPRIPVTGTEPGSETNLPVQPAAPSSSDQAIPKHLEESGTPALQMPFAPAPPAMKEERSVTAAEPVYDSANSLPGSQKQKAAKRAKSALPEMEQKGLSSGDHDKVASEAAGAAQLRLRIRMSLIDPAAAPGVLREAVARSGGSLIDADHPHPRTLKARIPSLRMDELLEKLGRLGRVVERPQIRDEAGIVELEIDW
jgi:hypothetical protein